MTVTVTKSAEAAWANPRLPEGLSEDQIARAMQVSAPTVHEMLGRLEADGYVTRDADKSLAFTDTGTEHAAQIVRRVASSTERFIHDRKQSAN